MKNCLWCKTEFMEPIFYKSRILDVCDLDCAHDWCVWEECLKILFPKDYETEDFKKEFNVSVPLVKDEDEESQKDLLMKQLIEVL